MSAIPPALLDTGVTYRQLDHWVRRGWLMADQGQPGTGNPRDWPAGEVEVARKMTRLVQAGMTPSAAATVARVGSRSVEVTDHVIVVVTP